jgi:hypothetical protein
MRRTCCFERRANSLSAYVSIRQHTSAYVSIAYAESGYVRRTCCFERRANSLSMSTSPDMGRNASSPSCTTRCTGAGPLPSTPRSASGVSICTVVLVMQVLWYYIASAAPRDALAQAPLPASASSVSICALVPGDASVFALLY